MLGIRVSDFVVKTNLAEIIDRSIILDTLVHIVYRRTSMSETTFSGKKCLSGTTFHAI
jgi:hypothetical protein